MKRSLFGFTLVEMLVVISIIGILSSVLYANFRDSSAYTRDVERQANLRAVQAALEAYKKDHGRYPAGCNDPIYGDFANSLAQGWSGQFDSWFHCGEVDLNAEENFGGANKNFIANNDYIPGLVPKYIKSLPVDPKLNKDAFDGPGYIAKGSGYIYKTNAAGTVYKFMAFLTVEDEVVLPNHEFKGCDVSVKDTIDLDSIVANDDEWDTSWYDKADKLEGEKCTDDLPSSLEDNPNTDCYVAMCDYVKADSAIPKVCNWGETDNKWKQRVRKSYAVWGGYHFGSGAATSPKKVEEETEKIVCSMPTDFN